jgi:hypothetical protein
VITTSTFSKLEVYPQLFDPVTCKTEELIVLLVKESVCVYLN